MFGKAPPISLIDLPLRFSVGPSVFSGTTFKISTWDGVPSKYAGLEPGLLGASGVALRELFEFKPPVGL